MIWLLVPAVITALGLFGPAPRMYHNVIAGDLAWRATATGISIAAWSIFGLVYWVSP
jgi:hypothetical protein